MRSITREQRMLGAAAANVLFIITLFFPWYGIGEFDLNGEDVIPSWWLMLVFAALAAVIYVADAYNFELPARLNPALWAAYLTSVTFIVTLMVFLEGSDGSRKFGVWLALIFSVVATVLAVMHAREEAR
jgi:CDP-diglyceride synthetase